METCPRCGHIQPATATADAECAGCGVILAKAQPLRLPSSSGHFSSSGRSSSADPTPTLIERAAAALMHDERHSDDHATLAGRAILWIGLIAWTWMFATATVASNAAGASFLHLVDLVFHEAGHIVFMPLGRFMTSLGGSLFQLIVPAALMIVFLTKHRDPFGAAVCCWWTGQNLVDLAPYINDARDLQLVLLGGRTGAEVEGHDWEYILATLGWLPFDHRLARLAHATGAIVMIAACVWAALLIAAQHRRTLTPESRCTSATP